MKLQIISRETIRPSSPTPPHLRCYKLSLLDQLAPPLYMPMVLFFHPNGGSDSDNTSNPAHKSSQLKKSLSEMLTQYYPFAGRLTNTTFINCNDEGVDFLDVRMECQLSEILKESECTGTLNLLFPSGFLWKKDSCNDSLLTIQVSFFDCGGMAISLCTSHKIADGSSITTFLGDWAAMTMTMTTHQSNVSPYFIGNSILPVLNVPPFIVPEIKLDQQSKCVTRRYVFVDLKIKNLQAMVLAGDSKGVVQNPSRVEVVSALLYKCAMAATRLKWAYSRQPVWIHLVNMRPRMVPPLPTNFVGNFSWYFTISCQKESGHIKLHELVCQLRNEITQLTNLKLNDWLIDILESTNDVKTLFDDLEVFRCSSFCRFPLYQVDFGWGKPIWVCMPAGVVKNTFVLFDTPAGDGIEAMVTLEEQDLAIFERDEEFLAFASLNPIVSA
ncbi:unnamed protein product [Ilex paraguariensis]|uniref:Uncharacterized protein n=1 Tax=Ilex paraguariensis TaxID=185542 RepID=A0ABC8T7X8_9AQUA